MAEPAGLGYVENKNMKQVLDKPLKRNEIFNKLRPQIMKTAQSFKLQQLIFLKKQNIG